MTVCRKLGCHERMRLGAAGFLYSIELRLASVQPNEYSTSREGAPRSVAEQRPWVRSDHCDEHRSHGERLTTARWRHEYPIVTEIFGAVWCPRSKLASWQRARRRRPEWNLVRVDRRRAVRAIERAHAANSPWPVPARSRAARATTVAR